MLKSKKIVDWLYNYSLYFIIGALLLVIIAIEPSFVRVSNFTTILTQSATKIIYACGIAGIIVLGGTDLALGREVGLAAVVAASLLQAVDYSQRVFSADPGSRTAADRASAAGHGATGHHLRGPWLHRCPLGRCTLRCISGRAAHQLRPVSAVLQHGLQLQPSVRLYQDLLQVLPGHHPHWQYQPELPDVLRYRRCGGHVGHLEPHYAG